MNLKIVTPQGSICDLQEIGSITIPTETGVITILEDHIPLVTLAAAGEIIIENENKEVVETLAISKGVIEIRENNHVYILADTAERAEDIDIERAEAARKEAEEFLAKKHALEDIDFAAIQAQLEKEIARIEVGRRWKKVRV